ncbi:MAG TPA: tetratricopeptide repeat protein, partial [Candidatus Saccharimonadia bacterium]|nr:tetratricopeptide repeat protein [Candidatus Saccharimonadia bacterium]
RLNRGNFDAARDSAEKALRAYQAALPDDALRAARAKSAIGSALIELADYPLAKSHLVEAVDALRPLGEPAHLAQALQRLSAAVRIVDGLEPAIALQQEALALQRAHLAPGDPDVGDTLRGLAVLYEESQRYDEAERAHRESLEAMRPWGDRHPSVLRAKSHFAGLLDRVGKRDESKALFEEALAGQLRVFGADGKDTAETQFHYGIFLSGTRDHEGAERAYRGVIANAGATPILHAHAHRYLGIALTSQQRYGDAVEPLRTAEDQYAVLFGALDGQRFRAQANRGYAMSRAGDPVGVLVQREAVEGIAKAIGPEAYELIKPLVQLGQCERDAGHARDALAAHERALAIATKAVGAEHVMTHEAQYEIARDAVSLDGAARARARTLLDTASAARRERDDAGVLGAYLLASARLAQASGEGERAQREAAEAVRILEAMYPATQQQVIEARGLLKSL